MKKLNRKRLNNKGFTLIELLAVIVILAVVMGIAANSVITSMNNARKGSLQDSAIVLQDAFNTAYLEQQITTETKILGVATTNLLKGDTLVPLTAETLTTMGMKSTDIDVAKSYVGFNKTTQRFEVCLTAPTTSSYYVSTAVASAAKSAKLGAGTAVSLAKDTMFYCTSGINVKSW